ncbi:hypothetical protein BU105_09300, partial [Staphylococcus xylosus]|uniref:hypothetical protein n=1 Tax=Staphylococcus xylosus TaxID=1288 RepID=UPI000D4D99C6
IRDAKEYVELGDVYKKHAIYNMKKQINTETIPINFFLKYMNTRLQIKSNTIDGESTNKNKTTEGTIIPIIEI